MPGLSGLEVAEVWRRRGRPADHHLRHGVRSVRARGLSAARPGLPDQADRPGAVLRIDGPGARSAATAEPGRPRSRASRPCSRCTSAGSRCGRTWWCGRTRTLRPGADIRDPLPRGHRQLRPHPMRTREPPPAQHAVGRRSQARSAAVPPHPPILDRQPRAGARGAALDQGRLDSPDPQRTQARPNFGTSLRQGIGPNGH